VSRKAPHLCILPDGRRVPFSIKKRPTEPPYFVCFRSHSRKRLERSTHECSLKRATDAAQQIIKEEYDPKSQTGFVSWDDVVERLTRVLTDNNNKAKTIKDYLETIRVLRVAFPASEGPADITTKSAKEFKAKYQRKLNRKARSPFTIANRLNKLSCLWRKWFVNTLEIVDTNPWADVDPPKLPKLSPRLLAADEVETFLTWLDARWNGWRLPRLFFTVIGLVGCRLGELCGLATSQLQCGRIVFLAHTTKGRKERKSILPPAVFAELKGLAGENFVWERYTDGRREILNRRGQLKAARIRPFNPVRLERWMQKQIQKYLTKHPAVEQFSTHDFRRRAMTAAYRAGVSLDRASVAFGCNPNTMRTYYLTLDETEIADEVLSKIQAE
jgi:integrase